MKILHVTSWHSCISIGGTESYIDGLCSGLESVGNIENYSLVFSYLKPVVELEKTFLMWPEASESSFQFSNRIAKRIGDLKPDLLFIHTAEQYETSVAAIAVSTGIPYYFLFHARSWLCPRKIMSYMGRFECTTLFNPWRCSVCYASGNTGNRLRGLMRVLGAEFKRFSSQNSQSCLHIFKR